MAPAAGDRAHRGSGRRSYASERGPAARGRGGDRRGARRDLDDLFRQLQRGTSVDPHEWLRLETEPGAISMRAMDLIAPIGKGQRCLIVAPPKAGKTTFLMDVAHAIERNHPEVSVYALLVDERPEEVTHFRRGVRAEVYAASSDLSAKEHVEKAEEAMRVILERVLAGEDVLLLLDSITRLARAYNNVVEGTGRTLTGGLDAGTMQAPRQVFGAARKIEEGGSLTILGTALIDTGSRMDEVIFQEFKGTGNTELVLSRELFERRIFPCIDIAKSGSRKEEKLVDPQLLPKLHLLRRVLAGKKADEAMNGLLGLLQRFPTNRELLLGI
ncbi:MAG: transcription termination factor Rho [Candidatus Eisenbacteria bacterium]